MFVNTHFYAEVTSQDAGFRAGLNVLLTSESLKWKIVIGDAMFDPKEDIGTGLSTWAFGLALASYLLGLYGLAIPALICGHIHLSKTPRGPGNQRGIAIAGLVMGYMALVVYAGNFVPASF